MKKSIQIKKYENMQNELKTEKLKTSRNKKMVYDEWKLKMKILKFWFTSFWIDE